MKLYGECPDCHAEMILDTNTEKAICQGCGLVIDRYDEKGVE